MPILNRITLTFADRSQEESYLESSFERDLVQGRTAITVGVFVYLLYGLLDMWLVPQESREAIWIIRLLALTVPFAIFALSYTHLFKAHRHLLMASVGLAAGVGIIAMLACMPVESASQFYPGMILATFFTYNFIGTRFIYALCADILLIIGYNAVFGFFHPYPLQILITHDFFIVSANLIGGAAGYLNERQKRQLFIRECQVNKGTKELAAKNLELNQALQEIKSLRGVIPICSYCHSICDDEGAWSRLEAYLSEHSDAQFSHGICPKCHPIVLGEIGKTNAN